MKPAFFIACLTFSAACEAFMIFLIFLLGLFARDHSEMVRVINNDYVTEIEVDLRGIYGESRLLIEEAIRAIEYNPNYSWNVN